MAHRSTKYDKYLDHHDIIDGRSLYDVSLKTLIWKNFLAGVSRAAGSLVFFLIFFIILGIIAAKTVWPPVQEFIGLFEQTSTQLRYTSQIMRQLDQIVGQDQVEGGLVPSTSLPTLRGVFNQVQNRVVPKSLP